MPSTPGGIESSCSRNSSISSIRKSLPLKGVKDESRESDHKFRSKVERLLVSPTLKVTGIGQSCLGSFVNVKHRQGTSHPKKVFQELGEPDDSQRNQRTTKSTGKRTSQLSHENILGRCRDGVEIVRRGVRASSSIISGFGQPGRPRSIFPKGERH
ncbi:hypothetical protein Tco_0901781 [Tanacetum coccineum]